MVTFTGNDVRALFSHPAHQHGLKLVSLEKLFQCDGCRQLGNELRYRCEQCDFDLHVCCGQAPASMEQSMFQGRALTFFHNRDLRPGGSQPGTVTFCDLCGDQVLGFLYHNREYGHDFHPSCAILPKCIRIGEDNGRVLELHKATGHSCGLCGMAGHRSLFLAYRFQDDDGELVYLHVACMMEANNSSDDNVTLVSSTTTGEVSDRTLATVQNVPQRRRDKFIRFCKIAYRVGMFSHSVVTLNPFGVVAAFT